MTPAEIEDRILRAEAAILVLKTLAAEMITTLPPERKQALIAGMQNFAAAMSAAAAGPVGLNVEATARHTEFAVREIISISDRPPLSESGGWTPKFGSPDLPKD